MRCHSFPTAALALAICLPALSGCGAPAAQRQPEADHADVPNQHAPNQHAPKQHGAQAATADSGAAAPAPVAAPKVNPNRRPGESDDDAASRLNEDGKVLVQAGKYEQALEKFRSALELFPLSNAVFNVGSMLYTLKRNEEAYPYLEETLKQPLATEQRKVVLEYRANTLKALAQTHAVIEVSTNPPGATMVINKKPWPYATPARVLVPFGKATLVISSSGFASQTVVIESSSAAPPKDVSVRLAKAVVSAKATVHCPAGADVFIDSEIRGYEHATLTLPAGPHVVRCGKGSASKAFERKFTAFSDAPGVFDYRGETR